MTALLSTVTGLIIVFNEDRQIVAVNHSFLKAMGINDPEAALGLRFGEAINCINACKAPAGCGTTPKCASCGAVIAMMAAIEEDREDEQICALTSENAGVRSDICLRVFAKPIRVEKNRWILVFAEDITKQQFWMNMEHVFFHDINNLLTSLVGNLQLMAMQMPDREDIARVRDTAERLCSEINIQKTLQYYKDAGYILNRSSVSLSDIKKEFYLVISGHDALNSRTIEENWPDSPDIKINTDAILVSRVLANMVINALEASDRGRASFGNLKLTH
jgi:signal transduction histidine kinase